MLLGFGGTEVMCSQGGGTTVISRSESGVSQSDFSVSREVVRGGAVGQTVSIHLIMSMISTLKDQLLVVV